MEDKINNPEHYIQGGIETIDFMEAKLSRSEFIGYLKGNIIKYIARANFKGHHDEDLQKAKWYQDKLNNTLKYVEANICQAAFEINANNLIDKIKPYLYEDEYNEQR